MAGWPTLIIHFSQLVKLDDCEQVNLNLTLLADQIKQQEAGVIKLPFPREVIPYLHYHLNSRQHIDHVSQTNQTSEEPTLVDHQSNILEKLDIVSEFGGGVTEDLPKVLGRIIGCALQKHSIVKTRLEELFKAASSVGGGDIVLSFDPTALPLAAIPWELIYYDNQPLFLCPGEESFLGYTRIIAYNFKMYPSPGSLSTTGQPIGEKVHVLAVSSKIDMNDQGIKLEEQAHDKLQKAIRAYSIVVDSLEHVSISTLQEKLRDEPPVDILNYWGHGDFKDGYTVLLMENEYGHRAEVFTQQFASLQNKPPVVVLHACQTARVDICHPDDSLPVLLNKDGVQAVVAMQFAVRIEEVTEIIIPTLFGELVKKHSIQRAVAQVRKDLYMLGKEGWYVPVLYLKQNSQDTTDYQLYVPFAQTVPITNPFASHGTVADTKRFVGRTVEVRKMWDRLRENSSFAIVGPAGAGKTSMLRLIQDEGPERLKSDSGKSLKIIWLGVLRGMNVQSVEQSVAEELGGRRAADLRRLLRNNHVILLVDNLSILEPQEVSAEGRRDQKFLEWLNMCLNQAVQIITTLRPPIDKLFPQSEKSPLYETIKMSINLESFSDADARNFIKQRLVGTIYTYEEFKVLVEGGKPKTPHQLRMECYDKFEELSNSNYSGAQATGKG